MKVTKQETLYYEDHGATLKHKCGKRIVALSLLSFSLIFWAFSFFVRSLIPTYGGIIVSIILSSPGQCSNNDDHHTFIYLQLKNYNSILRTRYDSIWMPPAVYREMTHEWHVWKNYEQWLCHKYDVNYMIMQSNMTMMKRVIIMERWKVAWQYISEWLWKCHNR